MILFYPFRVTSAWRSFALSVVGMLFSSLWVTSAYGFSTTNNLNVSVTVPPAAQISATPMSFGNAFASQSLSATASITVNLLAGRVYNITLDSGLHISGSRRMSNGAGTFRNYELYKDAAHTQRWGDFGFAATYTAGTSAQGTGSGVNQTFVVYGVSPAVNTVGVPSGQYADQVTVTIHY